MTEPRTVLVVTGSRADFGLWLPVLEASRARGDLEPALLVTAMHLDPRFGLTAADVRSSGFPIAAEVPCTPEGDSRADMASAIGVALAGMAPVLAGQRPDWVAVLGDRGEQLAAALAATHLGIPIAHLHGGERTLGSLDDAVRDAITGLAHVHCVATDTAAARVRRQGEAGWRIHRTGAPGLDGILEMAARPTVPLRQAFGLPETGPYLLVLQHPETRSPRDPAQDMAETLQAVSNGRLPALFVLPNADAGGRAMTRSLTAKVAPMVVPSLARADFITLLAGAAALVGNSSAALIEAPLLRVPAVNIGQRQAGRERGDNVVDVEPSAAAIEAGLRQALAPGFRAGLNGVSPYGDGRSGPRIAEILAREPIDERLLAKFDD